MLLTPCVATRTLTGRIKNKPKAQGALSARQGLLLCTHLGKGVGSEKFTNQTQPPRPSSETVGRLLQSSQAPHHPSQCTPSSPSGTAQCTRVTWTEVALRRVSHTWSQGPATAGYQRPPPAQWRGAAEVWAKEPRWPIVHTGRAKEASLSPVDAICMWQSPSLRDTAQIHASPCLTLNISVFSLSWKSCLIKRLPASCDTGLLGRIRN